MNARIDVIKLDSQTFSDAVQGHPPPSFASLYQNQYVLLFDGERKALVRWIADKLVPISTTELQKVSPLDAAQAAFFDSLLDVNTHLNVAVGPAGTGKTLLALAYATSRMSNGGKKLYLTKPTVQVSKTGAFGPVPGDIQDKFKPFLGSYETILSELLNGYWRKLYDQDRISFIPLEFTRGCTYKNAIIVLDEAQNASWHDIYTLASRVGKDCQLILLGDIRQVDRRFPKGNRNGLSTLLNTETFYNSPITSAVYLNKVYRSQLCDLVIEIDEEVRGDAGKERENRTYHQGS